MPEGILGIVKLIERAMKQAMRHECSNCGKRIPLVRRNYRYEARGLSNVVLKDIEVADCPHCGNTDVVIPKVLKIHRAIALALANCPSRLSGEQLRFLRKHLGLTGDKFGAYLHTDKTKISKWENGEDRIGPTADRLVRLLATALDGELRPGVASVAEHLPLISDATGKKWELHVDVTTLQTTFLAVSQAA